MLIYISDTVIQIFCVDFLLLLVPIPHFTSITGEQSQDDFGKRCFTAAAFTHNGIFTICAESEILVFQHRSITILKRYIFEFDFGNGGNSVLAFGGIRIVIIELFPQRFGCLYSHKALHQFSCAVEEAAGKITDGQRRTCRRRTDHSSQQGNEKKNDLPDHAHR